MRSSDLPLVTTARGDCDDIAICPCVNTSGTEVYVAGWSNGSAGQPDYATMAHERRRLKGNGLIEMVPGTHTCTSDGKSSGVLSAERTFFENSAHGAGPA